MNLSLLVKKRLGDKGIKFYDTKGNLVPYSQVLTEYEKLTHYLIQNNIKICAIYLKKDYHYFLTILACMECGITYIPLKESFPANRIEQIQEDAQFDLLLTEDLWPEIQKNVSQQKMGEVEIIRHRPVYYIFTSGSTGRPKGVSISEKALLNFFDFLKKDLKHLTNKNRLLQVTEYTFDVSLIDIGLFLIYGVELYFSDFTNNIFRLAYEIETYKIQTLVTVPNNLRMLLDDSVRERTDLKSLETLQIIGSRFSYGLYDLCFKYLKNQKMHLSNVYGPTEFTVYCHGKTLTFDIEKDVHDSTVSIGKPLDNLEAGIRTQNGWAAPFEKGELLVTGIQMMDGYVNRPDLTQKAIIEIDGKVYYRTGDIAYLNNEGEYFVTGRLDDTIKYRGYRINLLDIDSYLAKVPYIKDAVTVAIPDEINENSTICFMITSEIKKIKQIKEDLKQYLLDYQIPEKIVLVESFPLNTNGKVCKNTLKQMALEIK